MITFASVDLPDPFGPISAWISPFETSRSSPLRISFSPALTYRFLISRSANSGYLPFREIDELGERRLLKCFQYSALHPRPQELRRAPVSVVDLVRARHVPGGLAAEAVHRGDRPLESLDDLGHVDGGCGTCQPVSAARAAARLDEPGPLQVRRHVLQVGQRQPLRLRDRLEGHRAFALPAPELDHQPHAVLRLRREVHDLNPSD